MVTPLFKEEGKAYVYHYTSLATSLEKILSSGKIQFGPLGKTNDPRESKYWHMGGLLSSLIDKRNDKMEKIINNYRLNYCKILCLTIDEEKHRSAEFDNFWLKGFEHPRMWAQYAENHRGICMVFELDKLIQAVKASFKDSHIFHGKVNYSDSPFAVFEATSKVRDIAGEDDLLAEEFICGHYETLFLMKNYDWKSENEYRFIIVGKDINYEYLPIGNSLSGIILGCDFPMCYLPVVDKYRIEYNLKVGQMSWYHGSPGISEIQEPQMRKVISDWLREQSKK